jgi:D-glycero-D-manno-heptose 1,7-bisphosphate phosphatase
VSRPAVFLDRDGVINRAIVRDGLPHSPSCEAELQVLPGVREAITQLKAHGYLLIVVTNQPEVARGTASAATIERLNRKLQDELRFDAIRSCYHDDADQCECRKPQPGLLLGAARDFAIDLPLSYLVGDRWRDTEAGRRAGCRTFFVDHGYAEEQPPAYDFRVASLADATRIIVAQAMGRIA